MCRLSAYLGPPILVDDLMYRCERSVIRQSFDAKERKGGTGDEVYEVGNLNADGFGLGWYSNGARCLDEASLRQYEPCVFRDKGMCRHVVALVRVEYSSTFDALKLGPAWLNKNLRNLAKNIESRLVFAHVRAAGPGMSICECSCHPFQYGRYLFMHNGCVGGFGKIRRNLMNKLCDQSYDFAIENGCSDSSVAFALFIDQLSDPFEELSPAALRQGLVRVVQVICEACEESNIIETSLLNFVISDGNAMVATRYVHCPSGKKQSVPATLYFASG